MNKKIIYMGLIILPVYISNSTLGLIISILLAPKYTYPVIITHNTLVTDANFLPDWKRICPRDDQTEDCLRSGNCKA
jgi:hypothetical protein